MNTRKDDTFINFNSIRKILFATILLIIILLICACESKKQEIAATPDIAFINKVSATPLPSTIPFEEVSMAETTIAQTEKEALEESENSEIVTEPVEEYIYNENYVQEDTSLTNDYEEEYEKTEINEYSDSIDLLARVIWQEAGTCSEYCQWLVGSAALNLADSKGGLEAVVFDYNTFNVAYSLYDSTPSDLSYSVASRLFSGDRDYLVMAFRTDYYHDFGTPYISVDNVYFSTY